MHEKTIQNPAATEAVQPTSEDELILEGLPIQIVGQQDPLNPDKSLGYPNILYHGTKAEDFSFDESRDHRSSSVGTGARSGRGLYATSEANSKTFGNGNVVELIPHDARLIDLESPQASQPLSEAFKTAYLEDAYKHGFERVAARFSDVDPSTIAALWREFQKGDQLISKGAVTAAAAANKYLIGDGGVIGVKQLVLELASQINTTKVISGLDGVSIRELFAGYDPINGDSRIGENVAFDISPAIDFLTSQGVDGALTSQRINGEQSVVFWKLDKVGDHETWQRRLEEAPRDLGKEAVEELVKLSPTNNETTETTQPRKRSAVLSNGILASERTALGDSYDLDFLAGQVSDRIVIEMDDGSMVLFRHEGPQNDATNARFELVSSNDNAGRKPGEQMKARPLTRDEMHKVLLKVGEPLVMNAPQGGKPKMTSGKIVRVTAWNSHREPISQERIDRNKIPSSDARERFAAKLNGHV